MRAFDGMDVSGSMPEMPKAKAGKHLLVITRHVEEEEPRKDQKSFFAGMSQTIIRVKLHFESQEMLTEVMETINRDYVTVRKGDIHSELRDVIGLAEEEGVGLVHPELDIAELIRHIDRIFKQRFLIRVGFYVPNIRESLLTPGIVREAFPLVPQMIIRRRVQHNENHNYGYGFSKGPDQHPAKQFKQRPPKRL